MITRIVTLNGRTLVHPSLLIMSFTTGHLIRSPGSKSSYRYARQKLQRICINWYLSSVESVRGNDVRFDDCPSKSRPSLHQLTRSQPLLIGSLEAVTDRSEVCRPSEQQDAEGDEVQSREGGGQAFVVAGQAPEARHPGEGALDHPSAW